LQELSALSLKKQGDQLIHQNRNRVSKSNDFVFHLVLQISNAFGEENRVYFFLALGLGPVVGGLLTGHILTYIEPEAAGNRLGQHSIRINQQWRICFEWTPAGPAGVEIVDYN
jgi:hypothetical protein